MNKNSRHARNQLKKAKKDIILSRLQTFPGGIREVSYTLNYGYQPRHSRKGKVAGRGTG